MKKLFISLLLVLSASVASAADFPVTIESCGTPVTFSGPPKRAVINDLNMSEMAFVLDLQDRIVGLTGISGWYKMTPEFKKAMGSILNWPPNIPPWKHCWQPSLISFSLAGTME